jgi:hypothetical protein
MAILSGAVGTRALPATLGGMSPNARTIAGPGTADGLSRRPGTVDFSDGSRSNLLLAGERCEAYKVVSP